MTPTADRLAAEMLRAAEESGRALPTGRTIGECVTRSATYERTQDARRPLGNAGLTIASRAEFVDMLRRRTFDQSGLVVEDPRRASHHLEARTARVPSLVEVVPTEQLSIHRVEGTTYSGQTGGRSDAATLPELQDMSLRDEGLRLGPWGAWSSIPAKLWRDKSCAEAIATRMYVDDWNRRLEAEMLAGDGLPTPTQVKLRGVTQSAGLPCFARSAATRFDTSATGIAAVQDAGFFLEPLAVVTAPQTLEAILTERDTTNAPLSVRQTFNAVSEWIPSNVTRRRDGHPRRLARGCPLGGQRRSPLGDHGLTR